MYEQSENQLETYTYFTSECLEYQKVYVLSLVLLGGYAPVRSAPPSRFPTSFSNHGQGRDCRRKGQQPQLSLRFLFLIQIIVIRIIIFRLIRLGR